MLHWLQPKLSNKRKFFAKIFLFSGVVHTLVCFVLLFIYTDYNSRALIAVSSVSSDVVVRVLPFTEKKSTPQKITSTSLAKVIKKKQTPQPVKKVVIKKEVKKTVPVKKAEPKKIIPPKKVAKAVKKPVVKKDIPKQKKQQDNVKYVTQKEFSALQLQTALQESIEQVWTPPAGMLESVVCHVSISIGWDGKLAQSVIEESSGVLIYDIAVEQAVTAMKLPRQMWGKTVRVAFKP